MAMYWDWVEDSGDITHSSVFDPVLGFGGNGVLNETENNGLPRVMDGAYTDVPLTYWGTELKAHHLSRNWELGTNLRAIAYTPAEMEWTYNQTTYDEFRSQLEGSPHSAIHVGVGGGLGDLGTQGASPNGECPPEMIRRLDVFC
jgi:tyrosinase